MKKLIKLTLCLSFAITCANVSAMSTVKKRLSDTRLGHFVSNTLATAKLKMRKHTQKELDLMLFNTASIDPDKKISVIKKLINLGANVNVEINNLTPLFTAIAAGHLGENIKTIQLLLNNGAHTDKITICGREYTPLRWAELAQNSPAVIKLFIENNN